MTYKISYNMAVDLLRYYLEKIHELDKHKGTSVVKVQRLYDLNEELRGLMDQLRADDHDVDKIVKEIKQSLEKKYLYKNIEVYVDGAARGNQNVNASNTSGVAFAVYGDSQLLYEHGEYLGDKITLPRLKNDPSDYIADTVELTNNVTEYCALISSLEYLLSQELTANRITIYSDSSLVVNQVNMIYVAKMPYLIRLRNCAQELMGEFENITLVHISREQNQYVDKLVNQVLDKAEKEKKAGEISV